MEVKTLLKDIFAKIHQSAEALDADFTTSNIKSLKKELKVIRSFMSFVRSNNSDKNFHMPDKVKKVYITLGAICEWLEENPGKDTDDNPLWVNIFNVAKGEWERNYSPAIFKKFEAYLIDYHYGKIHPDVFRNFLSLKDKAEM